MLNCPPLAQPRVKIEHAVKSNASKSMRRRRSCRRPFQMVNRPGNKRQAEAVCRVLANLSSLAIAVAEVIVLTVTTEVCAPPAKLRVDGRIEHEAYCAAMVGAQVSATEPVNPPPGVTVRE